MAAFWQLAAIVSRDYGPYRMFVIYTLGGVIGFGFSYLVGISLTEIPFTIGASASVCSLVGAILYFGKSRGGSYGMALYKQVSIWVVFLFIFGLLVPGINNWGHGGGILAGILLGYLLGYNEKRRESWNHKMLAAFCAVLTVLALAWAVFSGLAVRMLA
jgi:rhomboid protease GluP